MTTQLPAEIAEAIEEFDAAVDNCSHAAATVGPCEVLASKVERARAALDAVILKHLGGWQDIGSAPTDGRHVLVARPGVSPARAWYENGRWWLHGCGPNSRNIADLTGPFAPTHWRLMPRPPVPDLGRAALADEGR